MFPTPRTAIELAVAILNDDHGFTAQFLHMKAVASIGAVPSPDLKNPLGLDQATREFRFRKVKRSHEQLTKFLPGFSAYEKAAVTLGASLKKFIDTWISAGGDFEKWGEKNPELLAQLHKQLQWMHATLNGTGSLTLEPKHRDEPLKNAKVEASRIFAGVLDLYPSSSARIGRCTYCQRYYVNQRGRKDSRFCPAPRNCGRQYTATQAVLQKAKAEKDRKLELLKRALFSWSRDKGPRKEYLVSRTGLTKSFITRACNKELKRLRPFRLTKGGNDGALQTR